MIVATGMTLGNGSFDTILAAVRRRGIPFVVYAQTGSAIVPRFLGHGVTGISAEPFPFSQFSADPTPIHLYRHAARPEFLCRFRWEPGSIAFWDNRATWHYAVNDYQGQRRLMHRITLEGGPLH